MVLKLASRLKPVDLPAADEALRLLAYADLPLRRDVLLASTVLQRDTLPAADRVRIIERLAPLLIDLGDATRAWDLLESLNGTTLASPGLRVPRFQAAVLTGHFDRASQVDDDAASWISLLSREAERSNPMCVRIYDEIVRRFGDSLDTEAQNRLSEIRSNLPGADDHG
jgi:hypothetical protein